jgi:hypothetical protein
MHGDIRQELAEAEWRLATMALHEGPDEGAFDADDIARIIRDVMESYPVEPNEWSR